MSEPSSTTNELGAPVIESHELFEILVREHMGRLRAFVAGLVRDPGAIEDIAQEAFVVAWRNLHKYERDKPFGPWLRGIARRLCLAHYRKSHDPRMAFVTDDVVESLNDLHGLLDSTTGDTMEDQLSSLRKCLEQLPEAQRQVLELHYQEDLDCAAIADNLGRSREGVKKILQRSRAWLGRCIEQRLAAVGGDA